VLSLSHQRVDEEWNGLIRGRAPGPWRPGGGLARWKVRVLTLEEGAEWPSGQEHLEEGAEWPSGQEHSDFIFSPRNVNACVNHNRCAVGLTLLVPSNRLSSTGSTAFPIAIAHKLSSVSPEAVMGQREYLARYSYTIILHLQPGFNTIAWSGHAPILYNPLQPLQPRGQDSCPTNAVIGRTWVSLLQCRRPVRGPSGPQRIHLSH